MREKMQIDHERVLEIESLKSGHFGIDVHIFTEMVSIFLRFW